MSTATDVNRALAYHYLLRAAMLPLSLMILLIVLSIGGLIFAANSISLWWLVFLIPLISVTLLFFIVFGAGFALLNALKPRTLSKSERRAVNQFIDYANETLSRANSLRGGPFAIVFGIIRRKYRNRQQSFVDAVLAPLRDAPELKDHYQQLLKDFGRVDAQNQADQ